MGASLTDNIIYCMEYCLQRALGLSMVQGLQYANDIYIIHAAALSGAFFVGRDGASMIENYKYWIWAPCATL